MNEYQLHAEYVAKNLADKTSALALVDRDQEEGNLTRMQALREVALLRVKARNDKLLSMAARVFAKRDKTSRFVLRMIVGWAEVSGPEPARVLIVRGWKPPVFVGHGLSWSVGPNPTSLYTVGARLVLRWAKLHKQIGARRAAMKVWRDHWVTGL